MMTTKVASDADITLAVRPAPVEPAAAPLPAASPEVNAVGDWVQALSELTGVIRQVVAPVTPTPVTVTAQVNPEQVRQDLAKVDMMVSQFKEPAWLKE